MNQEQVNHPTHYGGEDNTYEAIKVIESWNLGFCLGNTVKYISRAGKKDSGKTLEDLRKAAWYLDREIKKLEGDTLQAGVRSLKELLGKSIYSEPVQRPFPEVKLGPTIHPGGGLLIGSVVGPSGIAYCSDFGSYSLGNYDGLNLAESNQDLGATNRLKPVEDKAGVEMVAKAGMQKYIEGLDDYVNRSTRRKTLEDAYDEPGKDDTGWLADIFAGNFRQGPASK